MLHYFPRHNEAISRSYHLLCCSQRQTEFISEPDEEMQRFEA